MTHIKICGIKEEAHAMAAAEAGADFIGLVFAESPRRVTRYKAAKIVAALRQSGVAAASVGVFVNAPPHEVKKTAKACQLDWVQLSGDEPWAYCRELGLPVIKVIRVSRNHRAEDVAADLAYGQKVLGKQPHLFLLDANARFKYGGTGRSFNWKLARPVAERFTTIVAGGLTPENVAEAIRTIAPWGVDVSSGVETKGVKDLKKIINFIKAVKEADGR